MAHCFGSSARSWVVVVGTEAAGRVAVVADTALALGHRCNSCLLLLHASAPWRKGGVKITAILGLGC